ncbi:MAG: SpoIIE family protein phosphatase, partial [Gemmatimonadetes bacterium]|nr:serine/threonine-protein phosphatase [Gemmatimonadota bacterium]NIR77963.1 serine/threonine-protein phosphatase [Gemmatimonadota bacterium]NIT87233.1 serine/threonine-protein phosphatase [Gemmatimonadota bacterium]NIU31076.1 serine/threonine-protein phosphatase [Gemmatimonadota bacterium]NIU35812.1 SpoIIE family protein phosphatase [Gemmatimonadota bacterium]
LDRGLAVVADGMGGHPAGDVASSLAVKAILRAWGASDGEGPDPDPSSTAEGSALPAGERMEEAVQGANEAILREGEERPERSGMGTTVTALQVDADREEWVVGHVGDSRAYLWRDQELQPLTRDHTPLQEEVDAGRLSREEARIHPMSHVLSQALGTQRRVEPQIRTGACLPGDLFLLCSDGLLAALSEEEIEALVRQGAEGTLEALAATLVAEANDRGAPDNVTVALVRVRPT